MQKRIWSLSVVMSGVLMGCSGALIPQSDSTEEALEALPKGTWQVENLDQGGIIDHSKMTLTFTTPKGLVHGFTGCNSFRGHGGISQGSMSLSQVAVTKRACVSAISQQENRFIRALNEVTGYELRDGTWLIMHDAEHTPRLELVLQSGPKMDAALDRFNHYDCGALGVVKTRFVGPDTLQLEGDGYSQILTRAVSASGARYLNGEYEFWHKGQDAILKRADRSESCTTRTSIDKS